MDIERLMEEVNNVPPKVGYIDRINRIRAIKELNSGKVLLEYDENIFADFSDHTNHSDWDNFKPKPQGSKNTLKLKTIILKTVPDGSAHTDHSDHNDWSDSRPD